MIPNETLQTIETAGVGIKQIGVFKITDATQARILVSLSDKMYTRKELAVVREYCNNANDAHIVVGKPTIDVLVTLPTLEDLNFRVRDFGTGLTVEQIRDVYCILGESTKRNSAEQNGVLGYGCKAGFAHADSFTVTSWINGEQSVYNCIKGDSTRLHSVLELSRCDSTEPSGIEVCVPVKQSSMWVFHREAADFFKYWNNLPTIVNMDSGHFDRMMAFRNTAPTLKGEGWNIRPKSDGSASGVAFMGGVAYRIDWTVLRNRMALDAKKRVLFDLIQNNDVTLFFNMGEVQFVDSRESLEYTDLTLNALSERLDLVFTRIQESIQEKFDPAPNFWDAKIIYNAIFGTGILEVEKGEDSDCVDKIKILDGNLMALERTFEGTFSWNGIPLTDSNFSDIHRFDNATPNSVHAILHSPLDPVMVTYRRKKKRAKLNRCTSESNSDIICSPQAAVVLNDLGTKSVQSVVARYLIFKENSRVRTVHVLTFDSDAAKNTFYTELNFGTVPVIKLSEIVVAAKAFAAANKVSRSYGGGGGGARVMRYMDIASESVEENDVPIRDMEEGGIYIEEAETIRRRRRETVRTVRMGNKYSQEDPDDVVSYLNLLVERTGIDLDRVYIIGKKTSESKWFNEAKASGDWQDVWEYIKENITIDVQPLVDADAYNGVNVVSKKLADMIVPLILDKNSPILKLINVVGNSNYEEHLKTVDALKELGLWSELVGSKTSTIDFAAASDYAQASYPYLNFSHLDNENYANETDAQKISKYINAMDLYVDLTADNTPKPVATEEVATAEVTA